MSKDTSFTLEELSKHSYKNPEGEIYVAIKGDVFDVSKKVEMYGPNGGYKMFTGKDASRALGMSSLKEEDCVADYSALSEKELETLDKWHEFFAKRYTIIGKVNFGNHVAIVPT